MKQMGHYEALVLREISKGNAETFYRFPESPYLNNLPVPADEVLPVLARLNHLHLVDAELRGNKMVYTISELGRLELKNFFPEEGNR